MIQMYDGVVNSIETVTTGAINVTDTIINVLDETRIPEAPNILVLGSGASAETVKLVEKNGSILTVERGLQGTAKSWASGTLVARNFTEYDHRAFKENIETLNTNQQETTTQLAQNASDLNAHKAESASKHINESGNNANGSFIKFDDGTMIVRFSKTIAASGTDFYSSLSEAFPATFFDLPVVTITGYSSALVGLANGTTQSYGLAVSTSVYRWGLKFPVAVSTESVTMNMIAMGRWK